MDDPLVLFILCLLGAIALGVALAWAHLFVWPVDTGTHDFHRPLQQRANRDADARRRP
jgi:hypothetical protein